MSSGRALNAIGWCWANLGDLPGAVDACRRAVAVLHDCGDSVGEAATWDSLGFAHVRTDAHDEAVAAYRRAAGIYACIGDRYGEASALERLGDAHAAAGNPDEARLDWRRAATILTALGHPAAANVHERLRSRPAGA
jgi:tetratricopeptide (TPR) repeat protein